MDNTYRYLFLDKEYDVPRHVNEVGWNSTVKALAYH